MVIVEGVITSLTDLTTDNIEALLNIDPLHAQNLGFLTGFGSLVLTASSSIIMGPLFPIAFSGVLGGFFYNYVRATSIEEKIKLQKELEVELKKRYKEETGGRDLQKDMDNGLVYNGWWYDGYSGWYD